MLLPSAECVIKQLKLAEFNKHIDYIKLREKKKYNSYLSIFCYSVV